MKAMILLVALLSCAAVVITGNSLSSASGRIDQEKKLSVTQPTAVVLCKWCTKDGEVAFNHENHSKKKYSPDGTAVIACVECHHTDQPPSALTGNLKKSVRDKTLTSELLLVAGTEGVETCQACHLIEDKITPEIRATLPSVTFPGKTRATKLNDKEANHYNCETCHNLALEKQPALKDKIPTSDDCKPCHKPPS